MSRSSPQIWAVAAAAASALVTTASAQASGWATGQVNATMCYWEQPRAAVVRDTLYIDGGNLWWMPGMDTGAYGHVTNDQNPLGIVWTLNFSVPFAMADNVTADMGMLYKVPAGSSANNLAPNYVDGAMLANDDEWFLYGGLLVNTNQYTLPGAQAVQLYQQYSYGADKPAFRPGFINVDLPDNVTRYVAYGGAASAPSENKAWYFGGLRSPSFGPIYTVSGLDALTAINGSDTLITVDMATQNSETWTNTSAPAAAVADGRANPSLVWVPVGAEGILVAVGGVEYPEWVSVTAKSRDANASAAAGQEFINVVNVYDVASKTWYQQETTGGDDVGPRTRGCAVVAPAQDASSFNIYYYGGFDGVHVGDDFNDDVWVLSLPSFTWTRVYASSSAATHGRAGHQCFTPYPDQMLVVGGYTPQGGTGVGCLGGGVVQMFNLSSAEWMTEYTPTRWSEYTVPDAVVKVIGGSGTGRATATAPAAAGGWEATALQKVFATAYPTSKLKHYYPYPLAQTASTGPNNNTNNTNPDVPPAASTSHAAGHHTPGFVAPLVGVVGGLIVVTAAVVGILLYRRRRILMYGSSGAGGSGGRRSSRGTGPVGGSGLPGTESEATYDTGRNFVFSWLRAQPSVKHTSATPATSTYEDTHSYGPSNSTRVQSLVPHSTGQAVSPEMEQLQMAAAAAGQQGYLYGQQQQQQQQQHAGSPAAVEVANNYITEMMGNDPKYQAAELPGSDVSTTDYASASASASASTRVTRSTNSNTNTNTNANGTSPSGNYYYHGVPSSSAELESPLQHGTISPQGQQQPLAGADSPSPGQSLPRATVSPAAMPAPPFRESGISDLSEQDRRHLRQGSDGGQSVSSGVSSAVGSGTNGGSYFALSRGGDLHSGTVSPLGSQFPVSVTGGLPQPIPEADVGAEAAAEQAAAAAAYGQPTPASSQRPLQSPSQTSLSTPGTGSDSPGQSRRSVFRESEADLRE